MAIRGVNGPGRNARLQGLSKAICQKMQNCAKRVHDFFFANRTRLERVQMLQMDVDGPEQMHEILLEVDRPSRFEPPAPKGAGFLFLR